MPPLQQTLLVLLPILAAVISAVVFFFIGVGFRKRVAEREIGSAEEEATRILNDAIKSAEAKKREAKSIYESLSQSYRAKLPLEIQKETGSFKWTALAFLLPLAVGIILCFITSSIFVSIILKFELL